MHGPCRTATSRIHCNPRCRCRIFVLPKRLPGRKLNQPVREGRLPSVRSLDPTYLSYQMYLSYRRLTRHQTRVSLPCQLPVIQEKRPMNIHGVRSGIVVVAVFALLSLTSTGGLDARSQGGIEKSVLV